MAKFTRKEIRVATKFTRKDIRVATKFASKEIRVANILLELVDLIPQFDRQNPRLAFPSWNTKTSRYLPHRSYFTKFGFPIHHSNSFILYPNFIAPSSSSISPPAPHPNEENPSKGRKDGLIIDLNKDPEEGFASEDLDHLPSGKSFRPHKGLQEENFMDLNRRNLEGRVFLDGDKFQVNIIMNVQSSKPTLEKKRKREESMISSTAKKMRVDAIPYLHP